MPPIHNAHQILLPTISLVLFNGLDLVRIHYWIHNQTPEAWSKNIWFRFTKCWFTKKEGKGINKFWVSKTGKLFCQLKKKYIYLVTDFLVFTVLIQSYVSPTLASPLYEQTFPPWFYEYVALWDPGSMKLYHVLEQSPRNWETTLRRKVFLTIFHTQDTCHSAWKTVRTTLQCIVGLQLPGKGHEK